MLHAFRGIKSPDLPSFSWAFEGHSMVVYVTVANVARSKQVYIGWLEATVY